MTTTTMLALANAAGIAFFLFCLYRASRESRYTAFVVMGTVLYGLAVELLEVRTNHPYFYRDLGLMIGADPQWVPSAVGFYWAGFVFVAMTLTDRLGLPWQQRPPVDALIAVSVDLVGDPVASASRVVEHFGQVCSGMDTPTYGGLGGWVWCVPEESATWFSVPCENYVGWFLLVSVISFGVRAGRAWLSAEALGVVRQLLVLLAVIVVSVALVAWGIDLYTAIARRFGSAVEWLILGAALGWPLLILVRARGRLQMRNPIDLTLVALPLTSVVVCVGAFLWLRIDLLHWPWAVAQFIAAALVSVVLWCLPFVGRLRPFERGS